jgi:signal transduction histidine kinase
MSDFREVGLLIGILYLRRWYSVFFVCLITSMTANGLEPFILNALYHAIALSVAYLFIKIINKLVEKRLIKTLFWACFIGFYYAGLHVPLIVLTNLYLGLMNQETWMSGMQSLYYNIQFEMFSTMAISTFYYMVYETNKKLALKNQHLNDAIAKAEESEHLKTAFLQNMSHEIRTPLNGIQGFVQLLTETTPSKDQQKKYLNLIDESSHQLLKIVHDVIDISEIETHQMEYLLTKCNTNNLLKKLQCQFEKRAINKGLLFVCKMNSDNDMSFECDEYKVYRILEHILDNAIKFTKQGEINIEVGYFISHIEFYIRDNGIGIEQINRDKIFEKFSQVDYNVNRNYGGNGLGLAIAKGYADFLKGSIELNSIAGSGSTFKICIPRKQINS